VCFRIEDIDVLVLFNLIQSTLVLTNDQMKNYKPFQVHTHTHTHTRVLIVFTCH